MEECKSFVDNYHGETCQRGYIIIVTIYATVGGMKLGKRRSRFERTYQVGKRLALIEIIIC